MPLSPAQGAAHNAELWADLAAARINRDHAGAPTAMAAVSQAYSAAAMALAATTVTEEFVITADDQPIPMANDPLGVVENPEEVALNLTGAELQIIRRIRRGIAVVLDARIAQVEHALAVLAVHAAYEGECEVTNHVEEMSKRYDVYEAHRNFGMSVIKTRSRT